MYVIGFKTREADSTDADSQGRRDIGTRETNTGLSKGECEF